MQVICFLISLHCNCMGLIKERVQNETKKGCYKNKLLLFGTPETAVSFFPLYNLTAFRWIKNWLYENYQV